MDPHDALWTELPCVRAGRRTRRSVCLSPDKKVVLLDPEGRNYSDLYARNFQDAWFFGSHLMVQNDMGKTYSYLFFDRNMNFEKEYVNVSIHIGSIQEEFGCVCFGSYDKGDRFYWVNDSLNQVGGFFTHIEWFRTKDKKELYLVGMNEDSQFYDRYNIYNSKGDLICENLDKEKYTFAYRMMMGRNGMEIALVTL